MNVRILGSLFVFKFHILIKTIFLFNCAKIKIFARKSLVIAVILGCLQYLAIAFNVGWDVFPKLIKNAKFWNIDRHNYICKIIIENVSYFFFWSDSVFTSSTGIAVLLDSDLSENNGLTVFRNFLLSVISLRSRPP